MWAALGLGGRLLAWRGSRWRSVRRRNDILKTHVSLELESLDRIYVNGYVPNLQVGGKMVNFLTHRGFAIPSPALLERKGTRFCRAVETYAEANGVPVVRSRRETASWR